MNERLPISFLIVFVEISALVTADDPCKENVYFEDLENGKRNPSYQTPWDGINLCDYWLDETTWYRFDSPKTYRITDACVGYSGCGTNWPIWMKGAHPNSTHPGPISVDVCSTDGLGNCCGRWRETVRVQYCPGQSSNDEFYVYQLKAAPFCDMAYCADRGSDPHFTQTPRMSSPPIFTGPHNFVNSSPLCIFVDFSFNCTVVYSELNESAIFDVSLTFDGRPDPKSPSSHKTTNRNALTVTFPSTAVRGNMGKRVGCQVQSYWFGSGIKSSVLRSVDDYWVGIEYKTQHYNPVANQIEVNAAVASFYVEFNATVQLAACDGIKIRYSQTKGSSDSCALNFRNNITNTQIFIGTISSVGCRPYTAVLNFSIPIRVSNPTIWDNYKMGDIKIVVSCSVELKRCDSYHEPLMTTFDGLKYFTINPPGDYLLLRSHVGNRLFEVHSRTTSHYQWPERTVNTAVAVREGNDILGLVVVNTTITTARYLRDPHTPPGAAKFYNNQTTYTIKMPSGSYLEAEIWKVNETQLALNIYVYPLVLDAFHTTGLCGTYDFNITNDRRAFCEVQYESYCAINSTIFKLNKAKSYLNGHIYAPPCIDATVPATLCQCDPNMTSVNANCTENPDNIVQVFSTFYTDSCVKGRRKKRSTQRQSDYIITPEDLPIPPEVIITSYTPATFPTPSGISKMSANAQCQTIMSSFAAYNVCSKYTDMESIRAACVLNVLLLDSIEAGTRPILSDLKKRCLFDITSSVNTTTNDPLRQPDAVEVILKNVTFHDCPGQPMTCTGHGYCSDSKCHCDVGYTGDDCSLRADAVPMLTGFRRGCLCDARVFTCETVFVSANSINPSSNVTCKVVPSVATSDQTVFSYATVLSMTEVSCQLPQSPVSSSTSSAVNVLNISLSNDGRRYGNTLQVTVYDSLCLTCDCGGVCERKISTCYIDRRCYASGQTNPHNASMRCSPNVNDDDWTVDTQAVTRIDNLKTTQPTSCAGHGNIPIEYLLSVFALNFIIQN